MNLDRETIPLISNIEKLDLGARTNTVCYNMLAIALFGVCSLVAIQANEIAFAQISNETGPATQETIGEPPLNQNFVWQGLVSSSQSVLPDRNDTQTAVVLIPRSDGGIYNGILTFLSTKPVTPVVWDVVRLSNATAVIPDEFGDTEDEIRSLVDLNSGRTAQVVLAEVQDAETSGSIPFSGDAIELVGEGGNEDEPFLAAYTLSAVPALPRIVNDLETISNFNATAAEEGD